MKYAIIGGGIAGLYAAIQLITKYNINPKNITIYEKTSRWGGRIQTQTQQSYMFHCGAGRFKKTHTHLMNLIKRYGFEHKIYSFDNKKQVRFITSNNVAIVENKGIHQIISKVLRYRQKHPIENLHTINTFDYFSSLTDNITTQIVKTAFGYDAEFDIQNADATLSALRNDFHINSQYYSIHGYLEQIVDAMVDELSSMGVEMVLNCSVKEIVRTAHQPHQKTKYEICLRTCNDDDSVSVVDRVILALDRNALLRVIIPILNPMRNILSNSISSVPLCRIYAAFPKSTITGKVWFSNIGGTVVSNTRIRQFIPYDVTTGFCVISYTDGTTASSWNRIRSKEELITSLLHELNVLFPDIDELIPKPHFIKKCYWQHGCHVWNVGYDMDDMYTQIIHPVQHENIYICGEAYSRQQGWIEGALLSVQDMLDIMHT
jgi:protoporphyrinogen oxidase